LGTGVALALAASLSSCNTLSSGRDYTMSKVDRNGKLIEPRLVIETKSQTDNLDKVNPTGFLGLTFKGGYLPYLEAVERPEIVMFVTVTIRARTETEESLLWEKVLLNSELKEHNMVFNKDSTIPREDVVLVPPLAYDGQDITVSLRIIELDAEDNERFRQLINSAASGAAAFEPESAVGISVFQTALTFISQWNSDDIEFQFDFGISSSGSPFETGGTAGKPARVYDAVIAPRVGTYTVLKTEHDSRTALPSNYLDVFTHSLRYTIGVGLKLATLGIANWWPWTEDERNTDRYYALMGRPFGVDRDSTVIPAYTGTDGTLFHAGTFTSKGYGYRAVGSRVCLDDKAQSLDHGHGYITFSVVEAESGVDVAALQENAQRDKVIEALAINTGQLTSEQVGQQATGLASSIIAWRLEGDLRKEYSARIAAAKSQAEIIRLQEELEGELGDLKNDPDLPQATKAALGRVTDYMKGRAERRIEALGGNWRTSLLRTGKEVRLEYELPDEFESAAITLQARRLPQDAPSWTLVDPPEDPGLFKRKGSVVLAAKEAEQGEYEALITALLDTPSHFMLRYWVTEDPRITAVETVVEKEQKPAPQRWKVGQVFVIKGEGLFCARRIRVKDSKDNSMELALTSENGLSSAKNTTDADFDWASMELVLEDPEFFAKYTQVPFKFSSPTPAPNPK